MMSRDGRPWLFPALSHQGQSIKAVGLRESREKHSRKCVHEDVSCCCTFPGRRVASRNLGTAAKANQT